MCEECYSDENRITPLLNPLDCLENHTQYICGTCGRCILQTIRKTHGWGSVVEEKRHRSQRLRKSAQCAVCKAGYDRRRIRWRLRFERVVARTWPKNRHRRRFQTRARHRNRIVRRKQKEVARNAFEFRRRKHSDKNRREKPQGNKNTKKFIDQSTTVRQVLGGHNND